MKVTGPNGNSIFLPATGYKDGTVIDERGSYGAYWSATLDEDYNNFAFNLSFYDSRCNHYSDYRYSGFAVRPVTE
ncbi:MAG: hypothetical protein IKJ42_05490 [Bacteroidaceae bacterium]|nr:hypothetical protein [Bacteroidaceae bacterium]